MLKKIFILCFSGNQGGMELDAVRMCRRVSKYADVTLICMSDSPIEQWARNDRIAGFEYRNLACRLNRFLARALVDPRIVRTVRNAVKEQEPDLLIFFGTSEVKSIGLALLGLKTKLVLRIGTTVSRPKNSLFQRIAYRRVDSFIAISEHIKRNVLQVFPGAKKRPIEICYPVIEAPVQRHTESVIQGGLCVLYHSRFVRGKGQLDAIQAFEKIYEQFEGLSLILLGKREDGAYCREIDRYIETRRLSNRVHARESVSNVEPFLRQASVFLGPSYGEGFSNSFVEALGSGLICVVYDNTVFPCFRDLGFEFFMSRTGDVESLANNLRSALELALDGSFDATGNMALVKTLFSAEAEHSALLRLTQSLR